MAVLFLCTFCPIWPSVTYSTRVFLTSEAHTGNYSDGQSDDESVGKRKSKREPGGVSLSLSVEHEHNTMSFKEKLSLLAVLE